MFGVDVSCASTQAVRFPLHIPYDYDEFVPCFSVRARQQADAPTLEAGAVTLAVRRVTRSVRQHGKRRVFLLDAQALMYALRKGSSSSLAFKVQKIGALLSCADILAYYGYVPTDGNPGDPPSRGVKRTLKHLRTRSPPPSSWDKYVQEIRQFVRRFDVASSGSCDSADSGSLTVQPR